MRLERLRPGEAERVLKSDPVVILPMGTLEVHGRHLPLATDMIAPEYIVKRIEDALPDVLILPSLPYGNCDSQTEFPGTVSLGPTLLYSVLNRVFFGLYAQGARRFIVLNGHGPNCVSLDRAALDLSRKGALLAELNWWRYVWDINPAWKGGHGGGQETAAIMAIEPELVDTSAFAPVKCVGVSDELPGDGWDDVVYKNVRVPVVRPDVRVTDDGWLGGDALGSADAGWGREMLSAAADWAIDFINAFKKIKLEV